MPGRVQVTQAMAERLGGSFELEPRGLIDVKGKGPTPTCFLVGRRDSRRRLTPKASRVRIGRIARYAGAHGVRRFTAVGDFLDVAGAFLVEREAEHNLILGVASTLRRRPRPTAGRPTSRP